MVENYTFFAEKNKNAIFYNIKIKILVFMEFIFLLKVWRHNPKYNNFKIICSDMDFDRIDHIRHFGWWPKHSIDNSQYPTRG